MVILVSSVSIQRGVPGVADWSGQSVRAEELFPICGFVGVTRLITVW